MLIDARELPEGSVLETGVCIVGAGAAGITLAREFAGEPFDVCVLESGGLDFEAATQSLYEGENGGLPYFPLDANRQRSFGGTTNVWAGWCRPLDALDFEARPWVQSSGWPLSKSELLPYYERAHGICQLGPFEYDPRFWERRRSARQLPFPADRVVTTIFQLNPLARFGAVYREQLARSENVRVVCHANVLEIETTETAREVTRLRVGCLSGRRFFVTARHYILAVGGVENARLLLVSNAVQKPGLGNGNDLVGRHFMEHLHFPSGMILLPEGRTISADLYTRVRSGVVARLSLPRVVQECERLLNYTAMLRPVYWGDRSRVASGLGRIARAFRRSPDPMRARAARHAPGDTTLDASRLWRVGRPLIGFRLMHTLEQAPNPESRVTLSSQRDVLGVQRVRLEWRTTPLDEWTAQRAPALIGAAFVNVGLGRFKPEAADGETVWPPRPLQGLRGHHMGTTRMSRDPCRGVVDEHCRIHGMTNLFVAGSSVFPTAGAGTPTITIVALATRLADDVKSAMRAGS